MPPLDLERITSAARSLPNSGSYRTFANGQAMVRAYDMSEYDSWLKCALLPAAYAMVEHPEHEAEIRKLFHEVSAKGVNGPYDPGRAVGEENEKKLDQEVNRIRRSRPRADRPSLSRWISMAAESGCAQKGPAGTPKPGIGPTTGLARPPRPTVSATPFKAFDPRTLPTRRFMLGRHYIRKFVSGTFSAGGLGKSSLTLVEALSIATGRDLIGIRPPTGQLLNQMRVAASLMRAR